MEKKQVTKEELEFLDKVAIRKVANNSSFPEYAYNEAERLLEVRRNRYEVVDKTSEEKQK